MIRVTLNGAIAKSLDPSLEEADLAGPQAMNRGNTHRAQFRSLKSPEDVVELRKFVGAFYSEDPMKMPITLPLFRGYFDKAFNAWVDAVRGLAVRKPA